MAAMNVSSNIRQILKLFVVVTFAYGDASFAKDISENDYIVYCLPGIHEDIARGDILYCMKLAKSARSSRTLKAKGDLQYGLFGLLMNDLLGSEPTNRMQAAVMQKCMISHGYKIIEVKSSHFRKLIDSTELENPVGSKADSRMVDALSAFASKENLEIGE